MGWNSREGIAEDVDDGEMWLPDVEGAGFTREMISGIIQLWLIGFDDLLLLICRCFWARGAASWLSRQNKNGQHKNDQNDQFRAIIKNSLPAS